MTSAIKSLAYRPNMVQPDETKAGFVMYSGSAKDYHFWDFKTELKMETCTDEKDFRKTVNQLIESLSGDALRIATAIGVKALCKPDKSGIKSLRDDIRNHVFPIVKDEVKSLYREGQRTGGGILSRQPGEPIQTI